MSFQEYKIGNCVHVLRAATLTCLLAAVGCTMTPVVQEPDGVAPQQRRSAFQSLCAQNAVECTSSWPTPIFAPVAGEGQTVAETDEGYRITGPLAQGALTVQLDGSESTAGTDATQINFTWTINATDDDPCELTPGEELSDEETATAVLQPGFHYVRLFVTNNIIRDEVVVEGCEETREDVESFDFLEVELEIVASE
ncbi:MAG: hypothetical protein ACYTHJ_07890 [Planctomycetota bacterium]